MSSTIMLKETIEQKMHTYNNGSTYDGVWKNNKKHGQGTFIWPSGNRYTGEFVNDRKEGNGTMMYSDGCVYEGQWHND